jgi:hypothetical protein
MTDIEEYPLVLRQPSLFYSWHEHCVHDACVRARSLYLFVIEECTFVRAKNECAHRIVEQRTGTGRRGGGGGAKDGSQE